MPTNRTFSAWALFGLLITASPTAMAATPAQEAAARPEAAQATAQFRIGSFKVVALSDGTIPLDVHPLLKGAPAERVDALLSSAFESSPVETSINAFLVDTGSRLVLVDAGAGDLFGTFGGRLLNSLAAAGYAPGEISDIVLTHIHTDHSGGLAKKGALLFPNAIVHAAKAEGDFFLDGGRPGARPEARHREEALATVEPYRLAGRLKLFAGKTEILPGLTAVPAPGHTPGHSIYRIESGAESLEFWGDLIHVAAVQLPQPEITIAFDVDGDAARAQRLRHFGAAARDGRLVAAAHLNFPGIGRLRAQGTGYGWVPAPHRLRD